MTTKICKKCNATFMENIRVSKDGDVFTQESIYCTHDWQEPEQQYREIQQAPKLGELTREQIQRAVDSVSKRKGESKMPIKFIVKEEQEEPILLFGQVCQYQFFIDHNGNLCQKVNENNAVIIANSDGELFADSYTNWKPSTALITKILPKIKKIEF